MKSYAVIGLGRFGSKIAESLYENKQDVLALDINEELVDDIADKVTRAVVVDAKNKSDLKHLDIGQCDCAVIAVGSDLASSVLITMNVKSLGVKTVICKAQNETHREILEKIGADRVIIPEYEVAEKTARTLSSPGFIEFIELSDEYGIIEVAPPKPWIGKTVRELNIRAKYNINILGVIKSEKINMTPSPDTEISADCKLIILGEYDKLNIIKKIK